MDPYLRRMYSHLFGEEFVAGMKAQDLMSNLFSLYRSGEDLEFTNFIDSQEELAVLMEMYDPRVVEYPNELFEFSRAVLGIMKKNKIKIVDPFNEEDMKAFYHKESKEKYAVRMYNLLRHTSLSTVRMLDSINVNI